MNWFFTSSYSLEQYSCGTRKIWKIQDVYKIVSFKLFFRVVEVNPFLSDPALHLFLQTDLPISQMESYLKHGVLLSNIRDRVIAEQKIREQREKNIEANLERTCTNNTCALKRSLSVDTIISLKKDEKLICKEEGRGWSNFIGDGVYFNQVTIDKNIDKFTQGTDGTLFVCRIKK